MHVWETAGRTPPGQPNLKKVICEMGGKNYLEDVALQNRRRAGRAVLRWDSGGDLDQAVPGILHSALGFVGQKCSAFSRLIVLEDNLVEVALASRLSDRLNPRA